VGQEVREDSSRKEEEGRQVNCDLAWASGLFEGEGCFRVGYGNSRRGIKASVTSTDLDVLQRFADLFPFGKIRANRPTEHKQSYEWYCYSYESVQALGAMLWYGLGDRRRIKLTECLHEARSWPGNGRAGVGGKVKKGAKKK
jgi:hypothetical protein